MAEKGNLTKEDELLQIRLITEGVRLEVKGDLQWKEEMDVWTATPVIVPDWTGRSAMTWPNPYSSLKLTIDGNNVIVSEMGEVVGTAKLEQKPAWYKEKLSDGTTVESVFLGTHDIEVNISIFNRCYAADSGKRCKFCGLVPGDIPGKAWSLDETIEAVKRPVEATVIAVKNGWRGGIVFPGGAAPPDRRDQFTTDILEAIMTQFHESLTGQEISELTFRPSVYPPKDFKHLEKWKSLGITAAEFDNQVLDPAYFRAVCPGRGEQQEWFATEEAAAEVFGGGLYGCVSALVLGIEPMSGMLEGIEERISKGVYSAFLIFRPFPNAEMANMRAPSAEWYLEVREKVNDIYSRYLFGDDVGKLDKSYSNYTGDSLVAFF